MDYNEVGVLRGQQLEKIDPCNLKEETFHFITTTFIEFLKIEYNYV